VNSASYPARAMDGGKGTSVVVVTMQPEAFLERCLASVADQADEIVVVDNASPGAGAAPIAARYGARVVRLEQNHGFAGGVNAGVRAASGEYIALLNDDAFADPGWLAGSVEVLRDPSIAAVVPKLLFAWRRAVLRLEDPVQFRGRDWRTYGRHVTSVTVGPHDVTGDVLPQGSHNGDDGGGFWTTGSTVIVMPLPDNLEDEVHVNGRRTPIETSFEMVNNAGQYLHPGGWCGDIGFGARDDGSFDTPADRFGACGAAMVVRRETWERIGGLEESFFAYYEDVDWSWRARLAGLRIRYDPSLVVRHVHAQTSNEGSFWWRFFVARNRVLCMARNAPSRVVARLLTELPPLEPRVSRSLAKQVPAALARRAAAPKPARSREEVWAEWAGVNTPEP
jgi:GT2 family glycosyltransferase